MIDLPTCFRLQPIRYIVAGVAQRFWFCADPPRPWNVVGVGGPCSAARQGLPGRSLGSGGAGTRLWRRSRALAVALPAAGGHRPQIGLLHAGPGGEGRENEEQDLPVGGIDGHRECSRLARRLLPNTFVGALVDFKLSVRSIVEILYRFIWLLSRSSLARSRFHDHAKIYFHLTTGSSHSLLLAGCPCNLPAVAITSHTRFLTERSRFNLELPSPAP